MGQPGVDHSNWELESPSLICLQIPPDGDCVAVTVLQQAERCCACGSAPTSMFHVWPRSGSALGRICHQSIFDQSSVGLHKADRTRREVPRYAWNKPAGFSKYNASTLDCNYRWHHRRHPIVLPLVPLYKLLFLSPSCCELLRLSTTLNTCTLAHTLAHI